MRCVHLGAGRIGLGLVVPILLRGNEVMVVDRNRAKIDAIRSSDGYTIHLEWYGEKTEERIRGFSIQGYDEYRYDADVDLITTSVIVRNLPDVAPFIAEIIGRNRRHVFIAPMENSFEAVDILRDELLKRGIDPDAFTMLRTVLDRIVTDFDGLTQVVAEPYSRLLIQYDERFRTTCNNTDILSKAIIEEAEKKLFLVNGLHACAAYLGYPAGCRYISDVIERDDLREQLRMAGACYIDYLEATLGCDRLEMEFIVDQTLKRFGNYSIKDPLERVGRNMRLKLASNERICKPMEYNRQNRLNYKALEKVVASARKFSIGNDYEEYISGLDSP